MDMTHFNEQGRPRMVSVDTKEDSLRIATAKGAIQMKPETLMAIKENRIKKGDVLSVAQVAGIMAAKSTSSLIPMCHPLMLTGVDMDFEIDENSHTVLIQATVKTYGKTGVEMEALTAVSVAGLTIYDMCKAIDKDMILTSVRLMEKQGGKSGHYVREEL